jgi:DegV family protein with EDD domain
MRDKYAIITDSTTDLPQSFADSLGLVIIPYIFLMDGEEYLNYLDHRVLSSKDFYDALRGGKTASTSLVTEQRYIETFEPLLQEGKDILYMCLSSGLSSSYNQSLLAAETLHEKYPDRKLFMIDSISASMGQGLLAYYASKARDEGKSVEENAAYIKELAPHIIHWVRADDLNHLRRGGRVSGAAAFMGTMLNIKPMIQINDEGRLVPVAKMRGKQKSMEFIVNQIEANIREPKDQIIFISHSDVPEEAQELVDMITKRLGKREFLINDIGPVIGAHTGPGTLVALFVGNTREYKS